MRELSRYGINPNKAHIKAMHHAIKYYVDNPKKGWYLKPGFAWDGKDKSFKLRIIGEYYYGYAKFPFARRSVSGFDIF